MKNNHVPMTFKEFNKLFEYYSMKLVSPYGVSEEEKREAYKRYLDAENNLKKYFNDNVKLYSDLKKFSDSFFSEEDWRVFMRKADKRELLGFMGNLHKIVNKHDLVSEVNNKVICGKEYWNLNVLPLFMSHPYLYDLAISEKGQAPFDPEKLLNLTQIQPAAFVKMLLTNDMKVKLNNKCIKYMKDFEALAKRRTISELGEMNNYLDIAFNELDSAIKYSEKRNCDDKKELGN